MAVEAGANALGFVFASSPRRISPQNAKKIIQDLPKDVLKVGVFVNCPISSVKEIARYCNLTTVQFHGQESIKYCQQFKIPILKAIKVAKDGQFFPDPSEYQRAVEIFLVDTHQPDLAGGTGKTFPWRKAIIIKRYGSVMLAGGLRQDNVYQALSTVHPWGVDVSSGVETNGIKDTKKIEKFIQEVRRWKNEQNIT